LHHGQTSPGVSYIAISLPLASSRQEKGAVGTGGGRHHRKEVKKVEIHFPAHLTYPTMSTFIIYDMKKYSSNNKSAASGTRVQLKIENKRLDGPPRVRSCHLRISSSPTAKRLKRVCIPSNRVTFDNQNAKGRTQAQLVTPAPVRGYLNCGTAHSSQTRAKL